MLISVCDSSRAGVSDREDERADGAAGDAQQRELPRTARVPLCSCALLPLRAFWLRPVIAGAGAKEGDRGAKERRKRDRERGRKRCAALPRRSTVPCDGAGAPCRRASRSSSRCTPGRRRRAAGSRRARGRRPPSRRPAASSPAARRAAPSPLPFGAVRREPVVDVAGGEDRAASGSGGARVAACRRSSARTAPGGRASCTHVAARVVLEAHAPRRPVLDDQVADVGHDAARDQRAARPTAS